MPHFAHSCPAGPPPTWARTGTRTRRRCRRWCARRWSTRICTTRTWTRPPAPSRCARPRGRPMRGCLWARAWLGLAAGSQPAPGTLSAWEHAHYGPMEHARHGPMQRGVAAAWPSTGTTANSPFQPCLPHPAPLAAACQARVAEILAEIEATGMYELTFAELQHGARCAWRCAGQGGEARWQDAAAARRLRVLPPFGIQRFLPLYRSFAHAAATPPSAPTASSGRSCR